MLKKYLKRLFVLMMVFLGNMLFMNGIEAAGEDKKTLRGKIVGFLGDAQFQAKLPYPEGGVAGVVGLVIKGLLSIVVIIFFILIIIAGFRWMTAGGNEETVAKAKKNIANALIGVAIIVFAYAITYFVFDIILLKTPV